jgi:hypothetical protein
MDAARSGDGKKSGNNFIVTIGDNSGLSNVDRKTTNNILEETLGDYWNKEDNQIKFDMTKENEVIDAYNAMIKARDELITKGFTEDNNDYLREINREIKEMTEGGMADLINANQ